MSAVLTGETLRDGRPELRGARDTDEQALGRLYLLAIHRPRRLRQRPVSHRHQMAVAAMVDVHVVRRSRTTALGRRWQRRVRRSDRHLPGRGGVHRLNGHLCLHGGRDRRLCVTVVRVRDQRLQRTDADAQRDRKRDDAPEVAPTSNPTTQHANEIRARRGIRMRTRTEPTIRGLRIRRGSWWPQRNRVGCASRSSASVTR